MQIIFIFSSQDVSFLIVCESVAGTINFFLHDEEDYKAFHAIIEICSLIIIIFGTLVYNEIIVINICGLQEYTKNKIRIKAKEDFLNATSQIELHRGNDSDGEDDIDDEYKENIKNDINNNNNIIN